MLTQIVQVEMKSNHAPALAIVWIGKEVYLEYSVVVGDSRTHHVRAAFLGLGNDIYDSGDRAVLPVNG